MNWKPKPIVVSVSPGRGTTAESLVGPSGYLFIVKRPTKARSARSRMRQPMRTTRSKPHPSSTSVARIDGAPGSALIGTPGSHRPKGRK